VCFIKESNKDMEKYRNFPDENLVNLVNTLKARSPESTEIFNSFIHDINSERAIEFVNLLRGSKLYKSYPKSLTDDDRLFLAWFGYASTIDVGVLHDAEKSRQEFERTVREDNNTLPY
jgi:hypothetical protein